MSDDAERWAADARECDALRAEVERLTEGRARDALTMNESAATIEHATRIIEYMREPCPLCRCAHQERMPEGKR